MVSEKFLFIWFCATVFIILFLVPDTSCQKVMKLSFPNFPYRKKPYNEKAIKTKKNSCEMHPDCQSKYQGSVEHTNCVRSCMSPACYELIYLFDELEPGEVDVRFSSFKGCFTKERSGGDVAAMIPQVKNGERSLLSHMK
ncbi:uncharacterized protein LOC142353113 isoform X2 [Convolutriloba macropyga]|uniref:uncharacterized protein LOC142353113 isoform X2 n=1 Tax=Convolutriloba macropyga TaxID=536237 RepID=UPI003F52395C